MSGAGSVSLIRNHEVNGLRQKVRMVRHQFLVVSFLMVVRTLLHFPRARGVSVAHLILDGLGFHLYLLDLDSFGCFLIAIPYSLPSLRMAEYLFFICGLSRGLESLNRLLL